MPVSKRRSRVVYFRLSEEEFQRLDDLCKQCGARSLSDFARSAVDDFIRHAGVNPAENAMAERFERIDRVLTELNMQLKSLTTDRSNA